jgi:hypothetical protein
MIDFRLFVSISDLVDVALRDRHLTNVSFKDVVAWGDDMPDNDLSGIDPVPRRVM